MRRLEERDLRSLERRSMYSIFRPLDGNERLPREVIIERARFRRTADVDLGEALFLPALLVAFVLFGSFDLPALVALALALLAVGGVYALVALARRLPRPRA